MKLKVGEEKIIAFSHKMAQMEWGPYEFPEIGRFPDGRILVKWHQARDYLADFGSAPGFAVSEDEGETWHPIDFSKEPLGEWTEVFTGTRLPNGEYMMMYVPKPAPIDAQMFQTLSEKFLVDKVNGIEPFDYRKIAVHDVPDGLICKTYRYVVTRENCTKAEIVEADMHFPSMVVSLTAEEIQNPFQDVRLRVAPDGSLWQLAYQSEYDAETKEFRRNHAAYFFRSTDNGKSFEYMSMIPHHLPFDPEWDRVKEGFSEQDITFLPDGSMITILRTGFFVPSYIARSTDGGHTWSEPTKFDYCGTQPRLHTFKNGVTVAAYGRPGLYIRATDDPSGMTWDEPIEIIPRLYGKNFAELERKVNDTSCFNPDILPLNDHEFLLVYSDSRHRDEDGSIRKSIRCRKISVEV